MGQRVDDATLLLLVVVMAVCFSRSRAPAHHQGDREAGGRMRIDTRIFGNMGR